VNVDSDFPVYVPVPRSRLSEVMRLLDGPAAEPQSSPQPPEHVEARDEDAASIGSDWTPEALRALVSDAHEKQQHVLKYLAEHAGKDVTAEDMQEYLLSKTDLSTKYPGRALGAVIKALGKRAAYYDGRPLPFEPDWDPTLGNHYQLRKEYAKPILDAFAEIYGEDS
jgi:hypothetical protein